MNVIYLRDEISTNECRTPLVPIDIKNYHYSVLLFIFNLQINAFIVIMIIKMWQIT